MVAHGIRDCLQGVETKQGCRILLDGFKRYQCAQQLNIGIVPYQSLDSDEAVGIVKLFKIKKDNAGRLRIVRAKIPQKYVMETFPFKRQPKLNRKKMLSLYDSFDYMSKHQNII
ncbi:MAG: hypothetical protein GY850_32560, partial [bacterium]|nr:hypothetical protein [bacterium]